jgi:AcrR family transcriptional regulator
MAYAGFECNWLVTYDGDMPPDSTQTKRRILEAAGREFAAYGLAGARVDRIAETAHANKRSIYVHFGTKEELFDLVVVQGLLDMADAIPFDAEAIPEYAGALFDLVQERPEVARLTSWSLLERPVPVDAEVEVYRGKVVAVQEAQARGSIDPSLDAVDLLAMVVSLATSWGNASWSLRSLAGRPALAEPDERFRERIVDTVRAIVETK